MTASLRSAELPDVIYRLGREPDPWEWPDWTYASEDGTFGNRYDDPDGQYRVLYASTERQTTFRECLARFRPDLAVLAAEIEEDDAGAPPTQLPGRVKRSWLSRRLMGAAAIAGTYCDVGHSESVRHLRDALAPRIIHYGLDDLDAGDLRRRAPRRLTQEISRYVEYTDEVSDDDQTILFWKAILNERELFGATVLADAAGGLIRDITVLQRPWGVVANFRDTMLRTLGDVVPLPAWQVDAGKAPAPNPDAGVGQRPGGPLPLAPNVAFHSPLFTNTVYGQDNVDALQKLIDGIQGARTYLARFTSTDRLVEYWNCSIDGHVEQGIDVFKLDATGRVTDHTVWLRPWPVVTVLRDRIIAAKLPFLPADYWVPPAPANPTLVAEDLESRSRSAPFGA